MDPPNKCYFKLPKCWKPKKINQILESKNNPDLTELALNLLIFYFNDCLTKDFSNNPSLTLFLESLLNLITKIYSDNPELTINENTLTKLFLEKTLNPAFTPQLNYLLQVWLTNNTFTKSKLDSLTLNNFLSNMTKDIFLSPKNNLTEVPLLTRHP